MAVTERTPSTYAIVNILFMAPRTVVCNIINLLWSLKLKLSTTFRPVIYGPCSRTGVTCVASDGIPDLCRSGICNVFILQWTLAILVPLDDLCDRLGIDSNIASSAALKFIYVTRETNQDISLHLIPALVIVILLTEMYTTSRVSMSRLTVAHCDSRRH